MEKFVAGSIFLAVLFLPAFSFAATCVIQDGSTTRCIEDTNAAELNKKCLADPVCTQSPTSCTISAIDTKCPAGTVSSPNFGFNQETISDLNKVKGAATVQEYLGLLIKAAMGILGSIALVMFLYGGAIWMTAGGNGEKASDSLKIMVWAALGIAAIFSSYGALKYIFGIF